MVIKRLLKPNGIVSVLILLILEFNKLEVISKLDVKRFEFVFILLLKLLMLSEILLLFIKISLLFILPSTSNL